MINNITIWVFTGIWGYWYVESLLNRWGKNIAYWRECYASGFLQIKLFNLWNANNIINK